MVELVRAGASLRAVAQQCRVSLRTVQRWMTRAGREDLAQVDWTDRPSVPHTIQRTGLIAEDRVVQMRRYLREDSDLGEYGAPAIHRALEAEGLGGVPSIRTIGRILERRGALDGRRRVRRPPPPLGWYLPDVAMRRADVDSVDAVEDLCMAGGTMVDVVTCVSLHGGLPGAWPGPTLTTKRTMESLISHWVATGLPAYAQFDNAPTFTGAQRYPNVLGRLVRLCLGLGVVPVFVPPRESGFQAAVEGFNGRWQAKVWHRFAPSTMPVLEERSTRYVLAYRVRLAPRLDAAPARRPFPARWRSAREAVPRGRLVYVRRTDAHGAVEVLGHGFTVSPTWPHRLVRCEVALSAGHVSFYALRRRAPNDQPLLRTVSHRWDIRPPTD